MDKLSVQKEWYRSIDGASKLMAARITEILGSQWYEEDGYLILRYMDMSTERIVDILQSEKVHEKFTNIEIAFLEMYNAVLMQKHERYLALIDVLNDDCVVTFCEDPNQEMVIHGFYQTPGIQEMHYYGSEKGSGESYVTFFKAEHELSITLR